MYVSTYRQNNDEGLREVGDIVGCEVDIDYTSHNVPFTTLAIVDKDDSIPMLI